MSYKSVYVVLSAIGFVTVRTLPGGDIVAAVKAIAADHLEVRRWKAGRHRRHYRNSWLHWR
jgi:hypothetical protein